MHVRVLIMVRSWRGLSWLLLRLLLLLLRRLILTSHSKPIFNCLNRFLLKIRSCLGNLGHVEEFRIRLRVDLSLSLSADFWCSDFKRGLLRAELSVRSKVPIPRIWARRARRWCILNRRLNAIAAVLFRAPGLRTRRRLRDHWWCKQRCRRRSWLRQRHGRRDYLWRRRHPW